MVTVALLAVALLCWPARPWTQRRRSRPWTDPLAAVRRGALSPPDVLWWVVGAVSVSVIATAILTAGAAGGVAALIACWTATVLARHQLSARRRRRALTDIRAAIRTLARELHAGADPAAAVDSGRAVAKGEGAFVLRALAQTMRADDLRSATAAPGYSVGRTEHSDDADAGLSADGSPAGHAIRRLRAGWLLSRRYGVAFSKLIDALAGELAEALVSDARRAGEVAGPRMSGYVMAGLPLMGLLLGAGMGADPVGVLVGTIAGRLLLVAGVALTCTGLLWSARIVSS